MATALPCPFCDAEIDLATVVAQRRCTACKRELVVCKKYRLRGVLGRGGMGIVYDGERQTDKQTVAIKLMALHANTDWTSWELFERSTEILRGLRHDRLPHVYAFERTESGRLILVREAFDGGTLEERIRKRDDRLEPARVRELLVALLELLEYLQHLVPPVIHRDIKPANIMFRSPSDWNPVLVDFDTVAAPPGQRSGLTVVGTPGYAAPEQFAGESTPASDVYGLGATMLFVATHTDADSLPRKNGRFDVASQLGNLDPTLRHVLLKMVEPEVAKRYPTARDAKRELEHGIPEEPKPKPPKPPKPPRPERPRAPSPFAGRSPFMIVALGIRWFFVSLFKLVWYIVGLAFACVLLLGIYLSTCEKLTKKSSSSSSSDSYSSTSWKSEANTYNAECDRGHGSACFEAAVRFANHGKHSDAVPIYRKGCDLGNADCCNNLGVAYAKGESVGKDINVATRLYRHACDLGDAMACRNLAWFYDTDGALGRNDAECMKLRAKACQLKDGPACNSLGLMFENAQGVPANLAKAAEYYDKGCDNGSATACRNLGVDYLNGMGVEKGERRAVALFKKSCEGDYADACWRLGRMYEDGMGIPRDPERSASLYEKACNGDSPEACNSLGYAYEHGRGVVSNQSKAVELYTKACNLNNALGCNNLAQDILSGDGIKQDIPKAISMFENSCTNKQAQGCYNLGVLYRDGGEVPKDLVKAATYFTTACKLGDAESCKQPKKR